MGSSVDVKSFAINALKDVAILGLDLAHFNKEEPEPEILLISPELVNFLKTNIEIGDCKKILHFLLVASGMKKLHYIR